MTLDASEVLAVYLGASTTGGYQPIYEKKRLAGAFPELSARAINALACRWSYQWK
jgi:hypothetical protein